MLLSIVIPLLNEQDNLVELHERLAAACDRIGCNREIIFVDDGSTDRSMEIIRELAARDATVIGLQFSRNFGHEAASTAGLDRACGDATVLMDADLQDPPEMIEQMLEHWKSGQQIIYAVRKKRAGESASKRFAAWLFYRSLNLVADVPIPLDTGDFRLMDAVVTSSLRECREKNRFVRGLVAWTGFRSVAIEYDRPPRSAGHTHYGLWKLMMLSLDAFFGFSISPLRLASVAGVFVTAFSLITAMVLSLRSIAGSPPASISFSTCGLFFLGGVQMLCLGILGEYVGRIYRQTQDRPIYLISETIGAITAAQRSKVRAAA
jgi:polyisoprenyl-phosphate glycosyltransferase